MDKEIKEFWEACGFKPITHIQQYPDISTNRPDEIVAWLYPDNDKDYHLPEITLDNLFKYAVPEVLEHSINDIELSVSKYIAPGYNEPLVRYYCQLKTENGTGWYTSSGDSPTQALYQAIKQVILK